MALHKTSIKIPGFDIERRRIGKNLLVQKGLDEKYIDVQVHPHRGKSYLLKDHKNRDIYLKLP